MRFLRNLTFLGLFMALTVATQKRAMGQTVTCRGKSYTHNEVVGVDNGNQVIIKILNNRIYIEKNGVLGDNLGVIYAINPRNYAFEDSWYHCVNVPDPSTSVYNQPPYNYLGAATATTVVCNGKTITQNVWLAGWKDGSGQGNETPNGGVTYMLPKVVNGMLRIHGLRREYPNNGPDGLSSNNDPDAPNDANALLWPSFANNYGNPNLGFTLTQNEINACIWKAAPKYPDAASNCTTAPQIASSGISSISSTGLTVAFSPATSATSISWAIKDGSNATVRTGSANVTSGTSAAITYSALSPANYTLEVQGGSCVSSVDSEPFTVSCGGYGPTPGEISNITTTGLTFQFDGGNVGSIDWKILDGSNSPVRTSSSSLVPTNNTPSISFTALPSGSYTLELTGNYNCSPITQGAPKTKGFIIPAAVSPCGTAPVISTITNISGTGLTVNFTGANSAQTVAWAIKNGSDILASGSKATGGASSASLTFARLQKKSNTLEVQGSDCSSSVSSQPFTVTCPSGPTVTSIPTGTITSTGLTFYFYGVDIYSIDWRILDNSSSPVRTSSASIIPANDHPSISYSGLPNGSYTLEVQGGNTCQSSIPKTMGFSITTALPINVANFKAETKKEGIELNWSVVSESNGKGFEVLRFDDVVKSPVIIGEIPLTEAKLGNYKFLDEAPLNGTNYYQLKTVDLDGTFSMGRIVAAKFEQLYKMFAAPNPAKDFVDVEFESREEGSAVIATYSTSGKRIQSSEHMLKKGLNRIKIGVGSLSAGSYVLKVIQKHESHSLRVLKVD